MPFIWNMTINCLEFPSGLVKHFPAGSYYEQTKTWTGEAELELMKMTHSAWYTFGHTAKSDWKQDDLKLFDLLRAVPTLPPSRRLDAFIDSLFPVTDWVLIILEKLRGLAN